MPNLSTKDGTPTGGVFGFATMALEVIRQLRPDYVAVAWDKPKTNIRRRLAIYPQYKAGRKPAPADFPDQIKILQELLKAFGWPLYELDDYEADDIMGTLAVKAAMQDIETMLITSDLDMLQLIDPHIHVFALKKGLSNIELYSPKSFEAKYGIRAEQFLDLKALKGDSSDNIPGVPGIGEKTAIGLLKEHETLDGIYDNLALIKDSVRIKLEAGRELAYLSKKIGAIWTDAPLELNLSEVDGSKCQPAKVLEMFKQLEFRSLAQRLPEVMQTAIADHQMAGGTGPVKVGKSILIDTEAKLKQVKIGHSEVMYIHTRAAGKHGQRPEVLVLSPDGDPVYIFDLRKIDTKVIVENFRDVRPLVGYDVKSSLEVLLGLGVEDLPAVGHDVMIGAFIINSLSRAQTLTELAELDLGYGGSGFGDLDTEQMIARAPEIIAVIKGLYERQRQGYEENKKCDTLSIDIEWPLLPVLARMERTGMKLDTEYLRRFSERLRDQVSDIEQQIYGYADEEFNISSPSQLAEVLYGKLKLPTVGVKKGKTGFSTAASELDKLRGQHPIIDLITQYRENTKLLSTYVETLPRQVDENSRVHTTFNPVGSQTGRMSSNDPNLQNIPIRTELGRNIRTAFVADDGCKLVSADYSQFELRLAAVLAGERDMIEMFNRGADIHTITAAQIYDREPEEVSKQMRYAAKAVNFGIMYGQGPHALALGTGMTFGQAKDFIVKYFEIRPKIKEFIEKTRAQAKEQGYVETYFGRRRPTPDVNSANFAVREGAYRAAVNMPIQGTAADLMKMAMIAIDKKLRAQPGNCQMLVQVHDSILVECPAEAAERIAKLLKETMENIYDLPVRLDVDVSIGNNWGEL